MMNENKKYASLRGVSAANDEAILSNYNKLSLLRARNALAMTQKKRPRNDTECGQNLTELALIIGIVGLIFVGMQVYVSRAFQGKIKNFTDYVLGKEQSVYQQDVSGLEVNSSTSSLTSRSKTTAKEGLDGTKSLIVDERMENVRTSESKGN